VLQARNVSATILLKSGCNHAETLRFFRSATVTIEPSSFGAARKASRLLRFTPSDARGKAVTARSCATGGAGRK